MKGLLPEADVSNVDELRQLGGSLGIPLPDSIAADANGEGDSSDKEGADDSVSLLPDQQGQVQFIGPASSFAFHLKLRTLVGQGTIREFVLFGRNAADKEAIEEESNSHTLSSPSVSSRVHNNLPPAHRSLPGANGTQGFDSLITAFFEYINPDIPLLHEASFREAYHNWLASPNTADPSWICCFLCVLLLARRVARVTFSEDQEKLWWRRVQTLLPIVIFTSSITAVQAMVLAAVHLHNTNHRDACWNLTGTAIRIAYAIGLHQDKVSSQQTPLARELRRRIWWTLYVFEQMQVSSYDRPSAIEHPGYRVSIPNERVLGMAAYFPVDYVKWINRLGVHLGSACRAPKTVKPNTSEEAYVGPLSPAAAVLRDLQRWMDLLPQHLRMEGLDVAPPIFQRPLLVLHGMFHYTVIVLCRAALLARASILAKEGQDSANSALIAMATSCTDSGRDLGQILLRLESYGKFDAVTTCDIWYCLASSSVLVLDLVCLNKLHGSEMSDARLLLSQLADLAQRHRRNPHMPGTLEKFASIVPELHSMADSLNSSQSSAVKPKETVAPGPSHATQHQHHEQDIGTYPYLQSSTNSGAYLFADNVPGRFHAEEEYTENAGYPNARFDRSTPSHFMDFTINNIHDWNWGDLGSLLGNEAGPNLHAQGHGHAPPGPPPVGRS